jgi:phosphotriesterase-related protein
MRDQWAGAGFLNDPELAEIELRRYKDAGGVSIVDVTSGGLRENDQDLIFDQDLHHLKHPIAVKDQAQRTGVNVILGCGWYRETYCEERVRQMTVNDMADEIIRDITDGIDGTDIRAGIIGETGSHFNRPSPLEERVLRASARAQKETCVALTTHATFGPHGLRQLDLLLREGADPTRVAVGHSGNFPNHKYHAEIARRGAYVSFDRMGELESGHAFNRGRTLRLIRELLDDGLIEHLLFSHDVCAKTDYATYGGVGYDYLLTQGKDLLNREIGLTEAEFNTIMVDNPRRLLAGEDQRERKSTRR